MTLTLGDTAPGFDLPAADGTRAALAAGAPTVVVFTCNHCPYAIAWHERLNDVARDYSGRGVAFVAINSNDADRYPRDSFDAMRTRFEADPWPMPYLHDGTQEVAHAYGAKTTPDVFVLDSAGVLCYRGAPDADHSDESLRAAWLRDALDAVLAGEQPALAETKPVGCSIKWKA
jgi:peroxiredoxin